MSEVTKVLIVESAKKNMFNGCWNSPPIKYKVSNGSIQHITESADVAALYEVGLLILKELRKKPELYK